MFSLKCLTKKFNKQSLSEVKPAPLSETVDHTIPSYLKPPSPVSTTIIPAFTSIPPPSSEFTDHTLTEDHPNNLFASISNPSGNSSDPEDDRASAANLFASSPNVDTNSSTTSLSPTSSFSSSDSDDTEDEEADSSPPLRARVRSPRKNHLSSHLKMQRISSAEKRKYSQYKCSTGGSSPSSSDDEIKEAFGSPGCHLHMHSSPTHFTWAQQSSTPHFSSPSSFSASSFSTSTAAVAAASFIPSSASSSSPSQPVSAWNIEAARRPHKVVPPIGRHKHKYFAQMPSSFVDRPFLDFNKMQHSKRLVMVRRPMVIRNNSRVHSIQRPSPPTLQVPLDISQHSFQPVLMQT